MEYEYIKYSENEQIATIELNNPPVNALSKALTDDLIKGLKTASKSKDASVVVLKAQNGAKIFSAGHDIRELPLKNVEPLSYESDLRVLIKTIKTLKKPVISMVEGGVYGGAFETVMSTDIIFAANTATFAMTPVNIGMAYNLVGIESLTQLVGLHIIKEMLFTATPMSAERAEKVGLINYSLPADELENKTYEMAKLIASKAQKSVQLIKESLRVLTNDSKLDDFERIQGLRKDIYDGHDYNEGLVSFLEKRKPNFIEK
jgi:methylmalonyl-CoA decarboxylase